MKLTTATPAQVDQEMARLLKEAGKADHAVQTLVASLHSLADDRGTRVRGEVKYNLTTKQAEEKTREIAAGSSPQTSAAQRVVARLDEVRLGRARIERALEEIDVEFAKRGGWTRAFLVVSSDGHVHRWMGCSTCNIRTRFALLPDWSGADEAKIVEDAGERACTICYPSAPVEVLSRPTKMFSEDEIAAQAAREAAKAAKAARDAKKIEKALTADGSELVIRTAQTTEYFRTEIAGRNWLVNELGSHKAFGYRKDDEAIAIVLEALAIKHGVTVEQEREAIDAKVKAWIKRNS